MEGNKISPYAYYEVSFEKFCQNELSLAPGSIDVYRKALRNFHKWLTAGGHKRPFNDLKQGWVDEYMLWQKHQKVNYRVRLMFKNSIRTFGKYNGRKYEFNIAVKVLPEDVRRYRNKRYLTPEMITRIREFLDSKPENSLNERRKKRERKLVFELFITTGIRLGEAQSLTDDDFFIDDGYFLVCSTKTSTRMPTDRIWRKVPIVSSILKDLINEVLTRRQSLKFKKQNVINTYDIKKVFNDLTDFLGFPVHPHLTRHFFITKTLNDGVPPKYVAQIVGDSVMTILISYYHPTHDDITEKMNSLYGERFV